MPTHPHTHPHAHPHPHPHSPEHGPASQHEQGTGAEVRHRPQAGAVLDIGGSVGALLVHCSADLEDAEIQLLDLDGRTLTHTQVHRRTTAGGDSYAGLFPALTAGSYLVELVPGAQPRPVSVEGGAVAALDAR
jgi:hypothetical protein